jgi:hypothetical protein
MARVHSPRDEYLARLESRRAQRDRLSEADARFAHARLATFACAVVVGILASRSVVAAGSGAVFTWTAAL